MKLTNTNTCTVCNIETETIEYLFWEKCINVRNFWRLLEINPCEPCGYNLEIKGVKDVLLQVAGYFETSAPKISK